MADRAAGVLLATACGDALGAGYEFGPPLPDDEPVMMRGAPGCAPGEWTDDTSMAIGVARGLVGGVDLDAVAGEFLDWFRSGPADVGIQTAAIFTAVAEQPSPSAAMLADEARTYHLRHPDRSAGNGALMRTGPVALSTLDDPEACVRLAYAVGDLTHADPVSAEACALWSLAVRHAVLHGAFDLRAGLVYLSGARASYWAARIDEAQSRQPRDFERNGWVVEALQAAWSAVITTPVPVDGPARHLVLALECAVRGDADTVAAIAGALLGARWGASAIPPQWMDVVHGWPGLRALDLIGLGLAVAGGGLG